MHFQDHQYQKWKLEIQLEKKRKRINFINDSKLMVYSDFISSKQISISIIQTVSQQVPNQSFAQNTVMKQG